MISTLVLCYFEPVFVSDVSFDYFMNMMIMMNTAVNIYFIASLFLLIVVVHLDLWKGLSRPTLHLGGTLYNRPLVAPRIIREN